MEDFQYVVERKKPARICFGSGVARDTNPIGKGLSPFQRRYIVENFWKVHPQTYNLDTYTSINQLLNKVRSSKGVGSLASDVPRFPQQISMQVPSSMRSIKEEKVKVKMNQKPFGSSIPRETLQILSNTAGPGSYKIVDRRCFRTKFDCNFGRPSMVIATPTYCVANIVDRCGHCKMICEGDYWHRNFTDYLCQMCWEEEWYFHKHYNVKELKEFKKIRNCSYMHSHEGTTAAVLLKPWNKIMKQWCVENYLDLFLRC